MTSRGAIVDILTTYEKHGWMLRRVLLSAVLRKSLDGDIQSLFGGARVIDSDVDAAWFSRPPASGGVAWEIRYLGSLPFALLENIDECLPGFENALRSVETRLRDTMSARGLHENRLDKCIG